MKLILDRSRELVLWAAERIDDVKKSGGFPNGTRGLGIEDGAGNIAFVACFHNWEPWNGTMEVSIAADNPRWMTARRSIRQIFDYVFVTAKVRKLWTRTPARNERALRVLKGLGFEREALLKKQFGDDDMIVSAKWADRSDG